jgi:hypothetical protein
LEGPGEPSLWRICPGYDEGDDKGGIAAAAGAAGGGAASAPAGASSAPAEAAETTHGEVEVAAEAEGTMEEEAVEAEEQVDGAVEGMDDVAAEAGSATLHAATGGAEADERRSSALSSTRVEEESTEGAEGKPSVASEATNAATAPPQRLASSSPPPSSSSPPPPPPPTSPVIEQFSSLNMLRNLLPACQGEASHFHTPPGWREEIAPGGLRARVRWVQRDSSGELIRCFDRRVDLEEALEKEASDEGGAWLGQLVGGLWQIRPRAVMPALLHVLQGLVATGAVCALPPQLTGKPHTIYLAANSYFAGEAFPRPPALGGQKRAREEEEDEEEVEEPLADIELERLRNIQRNQEILRQLGLA